MRFADLWAAKETPPAPTVTITASDDADHQRRYALAALSREQATLAATMEGGRNHQLNTSAFNCAQLIPHISEAEIRDALTSTAQGIGLGGAEIVATLNSGIRSGRQIPRIIPASVTDEVHVEEVDAAQLTPEQASAVEAFWRARPVLDHIRTFAYSRMTAPWAVLGGCILRALANIPRHVVLPPTVGGVGSLNMLIGLVGPPGAGKGASEAAAAEALRWPAIHTAPLGSGEGITHAYARPKTKKELDNEPGDPLHWEHTSVLFSSPEVDQVAAISNRRGSTLMTQLRSAYSGERLGMQYVDTAKRIILPAHSYRFGLSVGIQPERANSILAESDGGTPQRFLWLPVTDSEIRATPPPEPEPWPWSAPLPVVKLVDGARTDHAGRFIIPIPQSVTDTIRQAHAARARGEGDALDGHSLFTRLKTAAALAVLDQRLSVSEEDWALAGTVMAVSDVTRARIQSRLNEKAQDADDARARRDARRQAITSETLAEETAKRLSKKLGRALAKRQSMSRSEARKALSSHERDQFDDVLGRLLDAGQIEVAESEHGEVVTWIG